MTKGGKETQSGSKIFLWHLYLLCLCKMFILILMALWLHLGKMMARWAHWHGEVWRRESIRVKGILLKTVWPADISSIHIQGVKVRWVTWSRALTGSLIQGEGQGRDWVDRLWRPSQTGPKQGHEEINGSEKMKKRRARYLNIIIKIVQVEFMRMKFKRFQANGNHSIIQ